MTEGKREGGKRGEGRGREKGVGREEKEFSTPAPRHAFNYFEIDTLFSKIYYSSNTRLFSMK
jgi:hypothetical protein